MLDTANEPYGQSLASFLGFPIFSRYTREIEKLGIGCGKINGAINFIV